MNYLCIDIEWNTPDNPAEQAELLSIGAACWDSVSKMTRTYFKLIKPQRMDLITSDTYETADYIYEHDRHYLDSDYIPSYYGGSGEND